MKFKVEITELAAKQYNRINNPYKEKIDQLAEIGLNISNIKALSGDFKGLFRIRAGDYRIIFSIEKELITIITILHRKDAYR